MSQTRRILAVGPARGGVGDAFTATAAALRDRGHSVELVRPAGGGAPALAGLRAAWRARGCLRRAEVVHIEFGANDTEVFWFALAALARRRDCVIVAHDHPELAHAPAAALVPAGRRRARALGHRLLSPALDRRLVGALLTRAGVMAGLSEAAARQRLGAGARAVATIPHGAVRVGAAPVAPSRGEYVLFAGFIGPAKGVDVLLEAWRELRAELALPLVLAGAATAPHDAWLAELLTGLGRGPNPPRALGPVAGEAAFQDVIERAAIVVLPYRTSNPASGVLARAMSAGRAIVTTPVPATDGLVADGENGLVVAAGDAGALAAAIRRLAADDALRDRLGAAAASRARGAFDAAAQVAALQAAYAQAGAPLRRA